MYTRHFGLTEKPFAIAPNPRYLYMSELHREAFAHLVYGIISSDGCFILLTGEVGTGKTTVCRCLLEQLPDNTDVALILNPKLTVGDLLQTICEELAISVADDSPSVKTYIDCLNRHLLHAHSQGRTTALIIDEAQNLDLDVLEQLRLLTNLETNTEKLLKIVLLGQPELRRALSAQQLLQVNQRITSRYHLLPLEPQDVQLYIQHRIQVAGGTEKPLFTAQAVKHVIKLSGGTPRLINILCDRALLGAYSENVDIVNLKILKKAAGEVMAPEERRSKFLFRQVTAATVVVLLCIGLSAAYYFRDEPVSHLYQVTEAEVGKPKVLAVPDKTSHGDSAGERQDYIIIRELAIQ